MWRRFLVMALASLLVTFAGCGTPGEQSLPTVGPTTHNLTPGTEGVCGGSTGPGSPPCPFTKFVMYSARGSAQTVHFTTSGPWAMEWECVATVDGTFAAPFRFTVTVMSPNSALSGSQPVNTVCHEPDNAVGVVGVQVSGEQWLVIDTEHTDAAWMVMVATT